jgi:hypothetical protein
MTSQVTLFGMPASVTQYLCNLPPVSQAEAARQEAAINNILGLASQAAGKLGKKLG